PEYTCIVLIRTRPHALLHFGGQLAAPVFKEIATKLFAQYVQRKTAVQLSLTADSAAYSYAGYGRDLKDLLTTFHVAHADSAATDWNMVYSYPGRTVIRDQNITEKLMPDVH